MQTDVSTLDFTTPKEDHLGVGKVEIMQTRQSRRREKMSRVVFCVFPSTEIETATASGRINSSSHRNSNGQSVTSVLSVQWSVWSYPVSFSRVEPRSDAKTQRARKRSEVSLSKALAAHFTADRLLLLPLPVVVSSLT